MKISIPTPCHENFHSFRSTDRGGFCQQCQKEVIDFTQMSNQEIRRQLQNNPMSCGRIRSRQLKELNEMPPAPSSSSLSIAGLAALGLLMIGSPKEAKANAKPLVALQRQTPLSDQAPTEATPPTGNSTITVSGVVTDEDFSPLPGVNVVIKGTTRGTVTDLDGKFRIELESPKHRTLQFSYVGFEQEEIQIDTKWPVEKQINVSVSLSLDAHVLGGLFIVHTPKKFSPRWFWWKIKGVFRKH